MAIWGGVPSYAEFVIASQALSEAKGLVGLGWSHPRCFTEFILSEAEGFSMTIQASHYAVKF